MKKKKKKRVRAVNKLMKNASYGFTHGGAGTSPTNRLSLAGDDNLEAFALGSHIRVRSARFAADTRIYIYVSYSSRKKRTEFLSVADLLIQSAILIPKSLQESRSGSRLVRGRVEIVGEAAS
jgi:hypothetical protein